MSNVVKITPTLGWQDARIMHQETMATTAGFKEINVGEFLKQVKTGCPKVAEYREMFSAFTLATAELVKAKERLAKIVGELEETHGKESDEYKAKAAEFDSMRDEYKAKEEPIKEFKKTLPAFTVAGTFKGRRAKVDFVKSSGIFLIDIDKIPNPEAVKTRLKEIPSLAFAFISPSENGVKAGFRVQPFKNDKEFKAVFKIFQSWLADFHAIEIDDACKDISRLCFVSHDPDIYINETPELFQFKQVDAIDVLVDEETGEIKDSELPETSQGEYSPYYIKKVIEKELHELSKAGDGERNNQLNKSAFALFGLLYSADRDDLAASVRKRLQAVALGMGLTADEIEKTLTSAYNARSTTTRKPPPALTTNHDAPNWPDVFDRDNGGFRVLATRGNLEELMRFYNITARYDVIKLRPNIENIKSLPGEEENSLIAFLKDKCGLHSLSKSVVDEQLTAITQHHPYNPVVTWLQNIERTKTHNPIDELIELLPVKNKAWAKVAFYRWFIQCVAAADRAVQTPNKDALPKFESVLTFYGGQGLKKTAFIRSLLPIEIKSYVKDGISLDLKDKDSKTEALTAWITELGELDATFKRSDISAIKAFLSRQEDEIRRPYARAAAILPRQTSFFGSVNEERFLRDETGNRRYLPVTVTDELNIPNGFDYIDMWAFIWQEYLQGKQWWLTKEEEVLQKTALKAHEDNSMEDMILDVFDFERPRKHKLSGSRIIGDLHLTPNRATSTQIGNTLKKMGIERQNRCYLMPPNRMLEFEDNI